MHLENISLVNFRNYKESHFSLGIEAQLVRGSDMLFVGDSQSSCQPILETDSIISTILKQLDYANVQRR